MQESIQMPKLARTIYPPYAWAIFHGMKWWETTPHRVNIRGRVAIHAATTTPPGARLRIMAELHSQNLLRDSGESCMEWLASLPHGVVIGTV